MADDTQAVEQPTAGETTAAEEQPVKGDAPNPWEQLERESGENDGRGLERLNRSLELMREDVKPPEVAPSEEPAADEVVAGEEEAPEPDHTEPEAESAQEEPEGESPEGGEDELRYELGVEGDDPDADPDVEWDEGVTVRFKADGDTHEVQSMNELVELAQKGIGAESRFAEAKELRRQSQQRVQELESTVEDVRSKANSIIEAILTDEQAFEEYLEAYQEAKRKAEDPEYQELREKAKKAEELEEKVQEDETELAEQFWSHVDGLIEDKLPEEKYLRPTDANLIKQHFYSLAQTQAQRVLEDPQVQAHAESEGWTDEELEQYAALQGRAVLTEDNLYAVMERLNEEIAERVGGPSRPAENDAGGSEGDPEASAEKHNRYVEEKQEQKERNRMVRGGGAAPAGGSKEPDLERKEGETSFDARMRNMKEMLRSG